jgi:predicted nuclease with TOPRIM domain
MRIANARYLAQQSQLRMTRQKLESARDEIERLEHQVRSLENSNESAATQARVKEDEKAELEAKLKKWEQRNQVLAGRYLQLREEYEVLSNRRKGDIVSFTSPWGREAELIG